MNPTTSMSRKNRNSGRAALRAILLASIGISLPLAACSRQATDAEGRRLPDDDRVIADVMPTDTENVIGVATTNDGAGEAYLHAKDLAWYFDRGVVVKRKARLPDEPNAVVVVGGLARYVWTGDRYEYLKFLPTHNEYEGIPAPDDKELADFIRDHIDQVFAAREHTIVDIDSVELEDQPWEWHSPTSFTVPFRIRYEYIKNDTTLESRDDVFAVRLYRESMNGPLANLLATETSRTILGERQRTASEIRSMPTLRSGLQ